MYSLPTVKITFQGNPITLKYFNEHPEIQHMYPTKEQFMTLLYIPLLHKMQQMGTTELLEISENAIQINGIP
jgi:hypothetical protein